jgi:hypothetical protein
MSIGNPERFPWGENHPSSGARVRAALIFAALACLALFLTFVESPSRHTDFSNVWFGAKALLEGRNPYALIGPGRELDMQYPLIYPAPSLILALPFAILGEKIAAMLFVGVSVMLLVYGITKDGWHRIPILLSAAFLDSVTAAQWTILLTAALFLPLIAAFAPCKPQTGAAAISGLTSRRDFLAALVSGGIALAVSFILLPDWYRDWVASLRSANVVLIPARYAIGAASLTVLVRWRRPEAWVIAVTALLPQTFMWYSGLMLLALASTYREAVVVSIISTLGYLTATLVVLSNPAHVGEIAWSIYLATTFLPIAVIVWSRPNVGPLPYWLAALGLIQRKTNTTDSSV